MSSGDYLPSYQEAIMANRETVYAVEMDNPKPERNPKEHKVISVLRRVLNTNPYSQELPYLIQKSVVVNAVPEDPLRVEPDHVVPEEYPQASWESLKRHHRA